MTAKCGFGYEGRCCCECALHLVAKPRCVCLGGTREHLPYPMPGDNEMVVIAKTVRCQELEAKERQTARYVCLAFAHEGIAQTDWDEHGSCEEWRPKEQPTGA